MARAVSAVVAGHLCLDIFPDMSRLPSGQFYELFSPGHLLFVGPPAFTTGGSVSNTGLALHCLGVSTRLVAKIGADPFGQIVRQVISSFDPALLEGIVSDPSATTSYTVVISPPGVDRIFLHSPAANDDFCAADIPDALVSKADLFHFGYPPLMGRMYAEGGKALVEVFQRARQTGVTTSLDLAFPDPSSESGRADWVAILRKTLPYVDIFLPSIEELLFMLRRETFDQLQQVSGGSLLPAITPGLCSDLSLQLLDMGVKIAGIKLGERGLYLRTANLEKLASLGRARPANLPAWASKELWAPCFQVNVVGTTGAGDATIAGFLTGLLKGLCPEEAATMAVAVGACNVEAPDALSGIRTWEDTRARVARGWPRLPLHLSGAGWQFDPRYGLWHTC